jgi:cysteine desulfurase
MGLAEPVVEGALRIGLGKFSTDDDIHQAAEILTQAVQSIKQAMAN